jgi:hypothetical protein
LNGLSDERVIERAELLLPLIDDPHAFKTKVNDIVAQERARLCLEPLESAAF